jgi:hypothetical protein
MPLQMNTTVIVYNRGSAFLPRVWQHWYVPYRLTRYLLTRLQIGSGGATAPATLPSGYSSTSGATQTKSGSTAATGNAQSGSVTTIVPSIPIFAALLGIIIVL